MKKIRTLMGLLLVMVFSFEMAGQQPYKAPVIHDLQGSVRRVKIKTEDPLALKKKLDFLQDGRQKLSTWVYNNAGYPFAMGFLTSADNWYNYLVEYDGNNRVAVVNYTSSDKKGDKKLQFKNEYSGNRIARTVIQDVSLSTPRIVMEYEFSGEKYDPHGNWIERDVVLTKDPGTGQSAQKMYHEVRTIEYF